MRIGKYTVGIAYRLSWWMFGISRYPFKNSGKKSTTTYSRVLLNKTFSDVLILNYF